VQRQIHVTRHIASNRRLSREADWGYAPFFLFSALAGELADRFDRAVMVRLVKIAEVAIMALGLVGFSLQSLPLLLGALFLMGVHSSFYGPLKYAILPQQLKGGELLGATGLMEAGGFVAIITGQLLAGLVAPAVAGVLACGLALAGLGASLAIRPCKPAAAALAMAALMLDLAFSTRSLKPGGPELDVLSFLALPGAWRIVFDLGALAVSGGVFVIPLYALLQAHSPPERRARILAANNVVTAGVSVAVIAGASGLLAAGLPVTDLLALLGLATGAVGVATWLAMRRPHALGVA
jgi:MFS family permease